MPERSRVTSRSSLIALFDTATGGVDKDGWALGENPTEGDIALALVDAPRLESIAGVALREDQRDGTRTPWPDDAQAHRARRCSTTIACALQFETVEVVA